MICPTCGSDKVVLHCEKCGNNWDDERLETTALTAIKEYRVFDHHLWNCRKCGGNRFALCDIGSYLLRMAHATGDKALEGKD